MSQIAVPYVSVGALTTERVELWVRSARTLAWIRMIEKVATAGETVIATPLEEGTPHDLALRYTKLGIVTAPYSSADPSLWPAVSRDAATTPIPALSLPITSRLGDVITLSWTGGANGTHLTKRVEKQVNGGAWTLAVADAPATTNSAQYTLLPGEIGAALNLRVYIFTPWLASNTVTAAASTGIQAPGGPVVESTACVSYNRASFNGSVGVTRITAETRLEYKVAGGAWTLATVLAPNVWTFSVEISALLGQTIRFRARHEEGGFVSDWTESTFGTGMPSCHDPV